MSQTHPFENLLVIDFTHVLAGPACSYYLGLLGADVIKVESVHKGDAIRHRGGTDSVGASQGMSTSYLTQGAGKKSIAISVHLQPKSATLTDAEIEAVSAKVIEKVTKATGGVLRG